jgi:hypothetical protein
MMEITAGLCDELGQRGLTGRPIFWRRDREQIIADVLRFLREDDRYRRVCGARPIAAELGFGIPGSETPSVSLWLPDGRRVPFLGLADRLDLAEDGTIHVLDYKTGKPDDFRRISEENPDERGRKLQLVVYALAARRHQRRLDAPVVAEYWFTSVRGQFRRIGYRVTDAVLDRVGRTVGRMVAGIEAGMFPHLPTTASTTPFVDCPFCDPDGLGVADLRRQFERKRIALVLAPYLDLVDTPQEASSTETAGV